MGCWFWLWEIRFYYSSGGFMKVLTARDMRGFVWLLSSQVWFLFRISQSLIIYRCPKAWRCGGSGRNSRARRWGRCWQYHRLWLWPQYALQQRSPSHLPWLHHLVRISLEEMQKNFLSLSLPNALSLKSRRNVYEIHFESPGNEFPSVDQMLKTVR